MSSRIEMLATGYTGEELIYALAVQACTNAGDMLTDFVRDPQYITTQGFPTRDTFLQEADMFALNTRPDMILDEFDGTPMPRNETDSDLDFVMRNAVRVVLKQYPKLAQLTVDLSR